MTWRLPALPGDLEPAHRATPETLDGLIETDAEVQACDSGGPLYDTAFGNSSAWTPPRRAVRTSSGTRSRSTTLSIAEQITGGVDNATIHQGYPGFLGISVAPGRAQGAAVAGVLPGGPAEAAGLTAGDVITTIDGTAIGSVDYLTTAMAAHDPGDTVSVTWTDAAGASHTARVTLVEGPAD